MEVSNSSEDVYDDPPGLAILGAGLSRMADGYWGEISEIRRAVLDCSVQCLELIQLNRELESVSADVSERLDRKLGTEDRDTVQRRLGKLLLDGSLAWNVNAENLNHLARLVGVLSDWGRNLEVAKIHQMWTQLNSLPDQFRSVIGGVDQVCFSLAQATTDMTSARRALYDANVSRQPPRLLLESRRLLSKWIGNLDENLRSLAGLTARFQQLRVDLITWHDYVVAWNHGLVRGPSEQALYELFPCDGRF